MNRKIFLWRPPLALTCGLLFVSLFTARGFAQDPKGALEGRVILAPKDSPLRHAEILIADLGITAKSDTEGHYKIADIRPGTYEVIAHVPPLRAEVRTVRIQPGETAMLDFRFQLVGSKEEMTVTASGREERTFRSIQSVTALDTFDLVERAHVSLGEVLSREPGVAKRSFGPGSSRPVIRGFDGDRVLVLQNGLHTGSLASQSGDHGENIDVLTLDRIEIVRGPAALLYGSNAIGGVVNAIQRHHQVHEHPHEGLRGYLTGIAGSGNAHGGGAAGAEYGMGNWLLWGSGSAQRTGDYSSPLGSVPNSATRNQGASVGFGRYSDRFSFSLDYGVDDRRYGIPFAHEFHGHHADDDLDHDDHGQDHEEEFEEEGEEDIDLQMRQHGLRFDMGLPQLGGPFDRLRFSLSLADYRHEELEITPETTSIGTAFDNRQFAYRAVVDQKRKGVLSGSLGFSGLVRAYEATGVEALSPPVDETDFAVFTLQEIHLDRARLQIGGRVERKAYQPTGLRSRSFNGFSGGAGLHLPLWQGGAAILNYSRAHRAPALEELYNYGPHVGNLAFEIGNPELKSERTDGLDVALRHSSERLRAQAALFYYDISDFVFLAPTGGIEHGLVEARYMQADSRHLGTELDLDLALHPAVWLNMGFDAVNAELKSSGEPLPRIPPYRASVGFDLRYRGLSVKPELSLVDAQDQLFVTESRTPGYTAAGMRASYMFAQDHLVHVLSFSASNLANRLYRNHLSLIKDLAPEMGRAFRVSYTVRFF
jgi:iron complex outermembrane recepter protein